MPTLLNTDTEERDLSRHQEQEQEQQQQQQVLSRVGLRSLKMQLFLASLGCLFLIITAMVVGKCEL